MKRLLAGDETMTLQGRTYSARHVTALLFGALRQAAGDCSCDLDTAVVTIPSNSLGRARFRTREAAGLAGIRVRALINEPTAAAIAYLNDFPETERVLVYDWGGGTIDATLLEFHEGLFEEKASRGIAGLGGIEVDRRLEELVRRQLPEAARYGGGGARPVST